jgi:hypothetical protein
MVAYHAANVPVQCNIVEVVVGSCHLTWILLGPVTLSEHVLLPAMAPYISNCNSILFTQNEISFVFVSFGVCFIALAKLLWSIIATHIGLIWLINVQYKLGMHRILIWISG